jgi:hypothetical protein
MLLVFGVALLLVAAAVVVLFAMLGELASRIPDPAANRPTPIVEPYRDAEVGRAAQHWPDGLPDASRCVLLVLSTMCSSCTDVADQLTAYRAGAEWPELGVVVTTGGPYHAADFIAEHGLSKFPHYVDDGGEWVATQFGLQHSPLALVVHDGRLVAAYRFNDVVALRRRVDEDQPAAEAAR